METERVDALTLYYDAAERETADLVAKACLRTLQVVQQHWRLTPPADCRVYVMTSWLRFMFHSAPWPSRILMAVTFPLWSRRARQMWPLAGGFHQAYRRRRAIGVKPPRLLQRADRALGERLFVDAENADAERKVQHITCHELTHACLAHLKPPMWLNEGLAMLTVDLYAEDQTIRPETVDLLGGPIASGDPAGYRDVRPADPDSLLYHAVRGYWIVRFLRDRHPDALAQLLARHHDSQETTRLMATTVGVEETDLWSSIDRIVADHYRAASE
jgi:hypothetical protein